MQYVVVVERTEHNWSAYVPDVWGCVATGATREEVERNIREALALHFEVTAEHDEPLPEPGTWTTVVDVEIPEGVRFARRETQTPARG
jgi:predicted RNase H-like HicB family nuclease